MIVFPEPGSVWRVLARFGVFALLPDKGIWLPIGSKFIVDRIERTTESGWHHVHLLLEDGRRGYTLSKQGRDTWRNLAEEI